MRTGRTPRIEVEDFLIGIRLGGAADADPDTAKEGLTPDMAAPPMNATAIAAHAPTANNRIDMLFFLVIFMMGCDKICEATCSCALSASPDR